MILLHWVGWLVGRSVSQSEFCEIWHRKFCDPHTSFLEILKDRFQESLYAYCKWYRLSRLASQM